MPRLEPHNLPPSLSSLGGNRILSLRPMVHDRKLTPPGPLLQRCTNRPIEVILSYSLVMPTLNRRRAAKEVLLLHKDRIRKLVLDLQPSHLREIKPELSQTFPILAYVSISVSYTCGPPCGRLSRVETCYDPIANPPLEATTCQNSLGSRSFLELGGVFPTQPMVP